MKIVILIFLLIFNHASVKAEGLLAIDNDINSIVLKLIEYKGKEVSGSAINSCQYIEDHISISSLLTCHDYLKGVYVTEDLEAYTQYLKKLMQIGFKAQNQPEYHKVLSADYDEVTSKMYFDIAEMSYKYNRFDDALTYLSKIDDSLDDEFVYRALLMYGLIYFEKQQYKKAKYYLGRINSTSSEYVYAKYNLALISMRSSWWAEAEEHIKDAIKLIDIKTMDVKTTLLLDKLYLTLGYSQLNRKNYRVSKKTFSQISINSDIKNRAILGIAMSEIGNGNLSKAAPLLKHLMKDKGNADDYLDALVILPQVYQHAGNIKDTVEFYKSALDDMNSMYKQTTILKNKVNSFSLMELSGKILSKWHYHEINKRKNIINQLRSITYIHKSDRNKINELDKRIFQYTRNILNETLTEKLNKVKNYMQQTKYSLAVIYDSSVADYK